MTVVHFPSRRAGKTAAAELVAGTTAKRTWQGIEADHPPCLATDYPALLAMAQAMLETRRKRFPRLVAQGSMAADEAAAQIGTFEAIAADWRWIADGEGAPAPHASIWDRRDALDASIATIAGLAREQGGFDTALAHQAQCVIALRWHLEPPVNQRTHHLARLTHEMRRQAAARRAAQAQDTAHAS